MLSGAVSGTAAVRPITVILIIVIVIIIVCSGRTLKLLGAQDGNAVVERTAGLERIVAELAREIVRALGGGDGVRGARARARGVAEGEDEVHLYAQFEQLGGEVWRGVSF